MHLAWIAYTTTREQPKLEENEKIGINKIKDQRKRRKWEI